uniref:Polynucleotide adenylyltransferase n=1 Tax=Panagrellus redivivus TaxID=6233 RepID=A0A7E4UQ35_PANRE
MCTRFRLSCVHPSTSNRVAQQTEELIRYFHEVNATLSEYVFVNIPPHVQVRANIAASFAQIFYPSAFEHYPTQLQKLSEMNFNGAAIDSCLTVIQGVTNRRFRSIEERLHEFDNLVDKMRSKQLRYLARVRSIDTKRFFLPTGSAAAGTPVDSATDVDLTASGSYSEELLDAIKKEFGFAYIMKKKTVIVVPKLAIDIAIYGEDTSSSELAELMAQTPLRLRLLMSAVKKVLKLVGIIHTGNKFLSSVSVCVAVWTWSKHYGTYTSAEPLQSFFRWFASVDFRRYGISLHDGIYIKRTQHALEVEHPVDRTMFIASAVASTNVATIIKWSKVLSKLPNVECFL